MLAAVLRQVFGGALVVHFAHLLLPAQGAQHAAVGAPFKLPLSGCTATPIGCWADCLGAAGSETDSRTLPIGVHGCCQEDQDPPGKCPSCMTACVNPAYAKAPGFVEDSCPTGSGPEHCPTCNPNQMTQGTCGDYCAGMGYSIAGAEYGVQCFCGDKMSPAATKNPGGAKVCTTPCPGKASEMCGGGCAMNVLEIDCGSSWGWAFIITLFVGVILYVGGFVGYNIKVKGAAPGLGALPHTEFWLEVTALCTDGIKFSTIKVKEAISKARGEPVASKDNSETLTTSLSSEPNEKQAASTDAALASESPPASASSSAPAQIALSNDSDSEDSNIVE